TIVQRIWSSIKSVEWLLCNRFPEIKPELPNEIAFITSQELLDRYTTLAQKQRENAIAREKGAIFIAQIGKTLSDGTKHDGRAPDYDDWELNGDILVWYAPLQCAIELSSMGIRVDPTTLMRQLQAAHCTERASLPFHRKLRDDQLPQTIGGGIGQSRLCLVLLKKAHIGEVQASFWPESMRKTCKNAGIHLL
ncbi:MAG: aspartate--ammonia ligase, partial [Bradymonadales bacterium]|nr:aspartate--ammonia ligase [Bradymonadales bacterium]